MCAMPGEGKEEYRVTCEWRERERREPVAEGVEGDGRREKGEMMRDSSGQRRTGTD